MVISNYHQFRDFSFNRTSKQTHCHPELAEGSKQTHRHPELAEMQTPTKDLVILSLPKDIKATRSIFYPI
jgi:hypothetical protein